MSVRGTVAVLGLWLAASFVIWASHPIWLCIAAEELASRFDPALGMEGAQASLAGIAAVSLLLLTACPRYLLRGRPAK
ncbi:hypothetical protein Tamer19_42560 [Cupriavidus sp. TA19]|nr:hypothetical protein Tamer19_42560 [Cupriavidus sp. TA19]